MRDGIGVAERSPGFAAPLRVRPFFWGFASQISSSATNFGLTVLAARVLGPDGLGAVFVGFTYYLMALGFQRALVTDPLIVASSTLKGEARAGATRAALSVSISWSFGSALVLAIAGILVPGEVGRGLTLFVPWLVPALVQDFWRVILFRDGRGRTGAVNDLLWVVVTGVTVPLVLISESDWAVVGSWGLGALAGMIAGFLQARIRPDSPIRAIRWWRVEAWPLGRWLGAEGIVYTLGSQGVILVLAVILSTGSLGGLRAVQAIFAPLTLLAPALALPGLPELSRRVAISPEQGRRLASMIGAAAAAVTSVYVFIALFGGKRLLTLVFGDRFGAFASVILPIAAGQLFIASTLGFGLLLKAQGRGKALLSTRVVGAVAAFVLSSILAAASGVEGAAWGMAIGSAANALLISLVAFGNPTRDRARRIPRSLALRLFRLIPPQLYQRIRRLPVINAVGVRFLDLFLPQRGFIAGIRIRGGPLKGMVLELDPRVQKEMVTGHYEPHVQAALEALIKPGDVCFDVGAHLGYFSLFMAKQASSGGKVVSFEPDPPVAERLQRNLDRNAHLTGAEAIAVRAALGATKGSAPFSRGADSSTGRLVEGSGHLHVDVTTFDHAAAEFGIPRMAKVDVEGGELKILQGASTVLRNGHTAFVIEAHSSDLEDACTRLLKGHGYQCKRLEAGNRTDCHILALPPDASFDHLSSPPSRR